MNNTIRNQTNFKLLSIVVPVYNEQEGIPIFYKSLMDVLEGQGIDLEIIFINDGSTDQSMDVLGDLIRKDPRVKVLDLSRNFGHQNALTAGIDFAKGSAVVLMDVDMEDKPETIVEFLNKWREGYDVVYAIRGERKVSWLKRVFFNFFHWLNVRLSDSPMVMAGIFCLMDQMVVEHFKKFSERDRYIPGLRSWVGFKQVGIKSDRGPRYDGNARVNIWRLIKLAFDSIFSFSTMPLRLSIYMGILFSFISFLVIIVIIWIKIYTHLAIPGWASILGAITFMGGVQLLCIGLQGEYLIRVFNEVKNRPNYIVRRIFDQSSFRK